MESEPGFLFEQSKLSHLPFGRFSSDYNGCGWIATWNLLLLLGRQNVNADAVRETLSRRAWFGGKFGLLPFMLSRYLRELGLHPRWTLGASPNRKSGICFFLRRNCTAHFVAYAKSENGVLVYNHGQASPCGCALETAFSAYLKSEHAILRLFLQCD